MYIQDVKTVQHMEQVNLKKYRITSVEDAIAVVEESGDGTVSVAHSLSHCWLLALFASAVSGPRQPVSWLGLSGPRPLLSDQRQSGHHSQPAREEGCHSFHSGGRCDLALSLSLSLLHSTGVAEAYQPI